MRDFWKVYRSPSPELFDVNFTHLTEAYPKAARYLQNELYSCREHWAYAWVALKFTAGVQTQGRVEKENDVNKSLGGPKATALQLFTALNKRSDSQREQDVIRTRQVSFKYIVFLVC
jgi:hypothetical protein